MVDREYPQTHVTGWTGWIWFAGFAMIVSGIVHLIYGLGGIFTQDWYIYTTTGAYVLSATTFGWMIFAVGVLLILSALLLMSGNILGRVIGVTLALASIIFNIGLIGAAPIWSIIAIVVDILIIYAIVAHGKEMKLHDRNTEREQLP